MRDSGALQSLPEQFALCSSASPTAQRSLHLTGNASDPGTPNRCPLLLSPSPLWSPLAGTSGALDGRGPPTGLHGGRTHPRSWKAYINMRSRTFVWELGYGRPWRLLV